MTAIFGSIFLGGFGLIFGIMLGKSIVKEEDKISNPAALIVLFCGIICSCGALWLGSLNGLL